MSLTGLFLVSFLFVHLTGNFALLLEDREPFNLYTQFMSTNGVVRVLEIGLLLGFVLHIYTAAVLTGKNRGARPVAYAYEQPSANSSWFSRNMGLSGTVVLLFLGLHLYQFYVGYKMLPAPAEGELKDMYGIVVATLKNPVFLGLYILAFVLLGLHLNHGFQSAFQTLGLNHKKYTPFIKGLGMLVSVAFPLGFIFIAVACALK
jgi:succinate dehydrogenase / fumarate reductase cytochrome b subunit